ncbi:MAG: hypothetical protein K9K38_01020 [Rhodoferax sp.]|nr:hypothetical protein [Rhodoferax sp.]MCF8207983.1 hypothetical protein [Rhodoferax sp.]
MGTAQQNPGVRLNLIDLLFMLFFEPLKIWLLRIAIGQHACRGAFGRGTASTR